MKSFKVASFNANSIRARMPLLLAWIGKEQPDVLCLQETKVRDEEFPLADFKGLGYTAVFKGQKSYNGVAILSKHPMGEVEAGLYGQTDEEARLLKTEILGISLVTAYVPQGFAPGTDKFEYKLQWLRDLSLYFEERFDTGKPLLVAGDFNVGMEPKDVFDPAKLRGEVGFHPEEQAVMRRLLAWGLVDVFRKHEEGGGHYTFWDYRIPNGVKRNLGWRIDYILATPPLAERSRRAWIDKVPRMAQKPSDHTFVAAEFDLEGLLP